MDDAADIARALGGWRSGKGYICRCPVPSHGKRALGGWKGYICRCPVRSHGKIAERDAQTVGILGVTFDDHKQHKLWAFDARDVTAQERKQRTRADERTRDREGAEARCRTSGR
jgi:hypothetical protein